MSKQENSADTTTTEAKFWDKVAKGYAKKPIDDEASYQKKLQITQGYLRPNMKVLEYGCGTGGTSLIHAPYVKHILATDISGEMIGIAKKKAKDAKVTNVDFQKASIDELSIPESSLDVVLGLSILHLLPNRQDAIKKTYSWLKPGGLFVTSTGCINDWSIAPLMKFVAPIGHFFGIFPAFFAFSKKDLINDFRTAGFEIQHEWSPENKRSVFLIGKKPE